MKKQYITLAAAILTGTTLTLSSCAEGNNGDMPPESTNGDTQITGPDDADLLADTISTDETETEAETTTGSTTGRVTAGSTTGGTTSGTTTGGTTGGI